MVESASNGGSDQQAKAPNIAYLDALFLGFGHPGTAPMLQIDAPIDWKRRELTLPERFCVPLAGPDGEPIGEIEFRFLTTAGRAGRFAAIAIHPAHAEAPPSIPRLQALSPLPRGGI